MFVEIIQEAITLQMFQECWGIFSQFSTWVTAGGITTAANTAPKAKAKVTTTITADGRFSPLRLKNSTAGFRPAAKKSEMMIKTKTWLALAKARSTVTAITAPEAARKPK